MRSYPRKFVFTKKPIPGSFKYKSRFVICGNFDVRKENESNYRGGAEATSFRVLIRYAACQRRHGPALDIKCAFLNALIDQLSMEDGIVVVRPPGILVEKGLMLPLPSKALL